MGLWGPAVFTIPLLAAWYSYEHLDVIRRTYDQTIRALGAAPELGGMVRDGHAERVADLARRDGHDARLLASRARRSSRPRRCSTTSARCASTSPTTAVRPSRSSVAQAGADDPARHAAARAGRRHHRRRVRCRTASSVVVAAVGDVGTDPEGRERVRRAVRRSRRPRRPRARSAVLRARVPLRRAGARRRSRSCSTGAGCSTISSC